MACFSLSLYFRRRLFSLTSLLTITFLDWVNNFHPAFFLDDKLILSIYCWAAGSQQTCPVGSQWPTHWWSHYQNRALIWAPQSQMVPIVGWQTLSREGPTVGSTAVSQIPSVSVAQKGFVENCDGGSHRVNCGAWPSWVSVRVSLLQSPTIHFLPLFMLSWAWFLLQSSPGRQNKAFIHAKSPLTSVLAKGTVKLSQSWSHVSFFCFEIQLFVVCCACAVVL